MHCTVHYKGETATKKRRKKPGFFLREIVLCLSAEGGGGEYFITFADELAGRRICFPVIIITIVALFREIQLAAEGYLYSCAEPGEGWGDSGR